ncbi:MAG: hypothetical protein ACLTW9_13665 [Enterocloster sp.]
MGNGHDARNYTVVVSEVEENGWKIVSCVRTARLTASYNQVTLGISILVISLLLLLFYLFSRYFLGQIIAPAPHGSGGHEGDGGRKSYGPCGAGGTKRDPDHDSLL